MITAEVFRSVGDLEPLVEVGRLIPGTTEFGYDPDAVEPRRRRGRPTSADNRHTLVAASDCAPRSTCSRISRRTARAVTLVVAWFGTDLRCGDCEIKPKVETATR